jgi:hypothetical protein
MGMAMKDRATDFRTIPANIHNAVRMLTPEERKDSAYNGTVRAQ